MTCPNEFLEENAFFSCHIFRRKKKRLNLSYLDDRFLYCYKWRQPRKCLGLIVAILVILLRKMAKTKKMKHPSTLFYLLTPLKLSRKIWLLSSSSCLKSTVWLIIQNLKNLFFPPCSKQNHVATIARFWAKKKIPSASWHTHHFPLNLLPFLQFFLIRKNPKVSYVKKGKKVIPNSFVFFNFEIKKKTQSFICKKSYPKLLCFLQF
jgi:hypothetical protein